MKYNEQHATTMLNALLETETLSRYSNDVRCEVIKEFEDMLLSNDVVDKSVVRRVSLQLRGKYENGND